MAERLEPGAMTRENELAPMLLVDSPALTSLYLRRYK
jgi:hypothetical protein